MSRRPQSILVQYAQEFLRAKDNDLLNVVNKFLASIGNYNVRRELRGASEAAIRKIHSTVTGIIDRVIEGKGNPHDIAHAEIFIKYQSARGQISREIADSITLILNAVGNSLNNREQMVKTARRARLFLDALVTLSKMA
ncbi:MAG: hypothetical protein DRO40_12640 [Thermoprotei archaeon]|nr:MAG: hypothetical protein DRO40_12640 [Thermoprotei archaeon]